MLQMVIHPVGLGPHEVLLQAWIGWSMGPDGTVQPTYTQPNRTSQAQDSAIRKAAGLYAALKLSTAGGMRVLTYLLDFGIHSCITQAAGSLMLCSADHHPKNPTRLSSAPLLTGVKARELAGANEIHTDGVAYCPGLQKQL